MRKGSTRNINTYEINGDTLTIITAKGEKILADIADLQLLKGHSWSIGSRGYPNALINGKCTKMHRLLIDLPAGMVTDHINRNKLDNRRSNLRVCTCRENSQNCGGRHGKLGILGVSLIKGKYVAQICGDGKKRFLGRFDTLEEAIAARHEAEIKYFGEFAPCLSSK